MQQITITNIFLQYTLLTDNALRLCDAQNAASILPK